MRVSLDTGTYDSEQHAILAPDGARVRLTPIEGRLLCWLAEHPGRPVSHDELLREVWGYSEKVQSRTLYTTVRRLRAKIERDPANPRHLLPEAGVGYRFEPGVPPMVAPPGFGREGLVSDLAARLHGPSVIALHGPGGVGKSWLARAVTARVQSAVFVDASGSADATHLTARVADALGLSGVGADVPGALLAAFRARSDLCIVLDDVDAAPDAAGSLLAQWHEGAGLRALVSSRRPVPGVTETIEVKPLDEAAATDLFLARAAPAVAAAPGAREAMRPILAELAGLPLAIELAAARTRVLGLKDIARHLARPLALLADPNHPDARHASVERALQFSYTDLAPAARVAFEDAAVFAGSFDLAAGEAVIGPDIDEFLPDVLHDLIDRSLIRVVRLPASPTETRYDLLAPVRAFGRSRLGGRGPDVARRHALWFARRDDRRPLRMRRDPSFAAQAFAERPDVDAAIEFGIATRDGAVAAAALYAATGLATAANTEATLVDVIPRVRALSLDPKSRLLCDASQGQVHAHLGRAGAIEVLDAAVSAARAQDEPLVLAAALSVRSTARGYSGDPSGAIPDAEEALALRIEHDFAPARGLAILGIALHRVGDLAGAVRCLREAVDGSIASGDEAAAGSAGISLGIVLRQSGRPDDALAAYGAAIERLTRTNQPRHLLAARMNRAVLLRHGGRSEEAIAEFEACRRGSAGYVGLAASATQNLGDALRDRGDWAGSRRWHTEVLGLSTDRTIQAAARCGLMDAELALGDLDAAERSAVAARAIEGLPLRDRARVLEASGAVAEARGDAAHAVLWVDEALALAEQYGEPGLIARVLGRRSLLAIEAGDAVGAEPLVARAERLLEGLNDHQADLVVHLARHAVAERLGDVEGLRRSEEAIAALSPGALAGALGGDRRKLAKLAAKLPRGS